MANEEHLNIIQQRVATWNEWRNKNRDREADFSWAILSRSNLSRANLSRAALSGANLRMANLYRAELGEANLSKADLREANLREANLRGVNLREADLRWANLYTAKLPEANLNGANFSGADLTRADLCGADIREADLRGAQFIDTDFCNANLTGSCVYGVSVWDIRVNNCTKQQNLIVTRRGEAVITVDNIKVAQFIYLLLNNQEIRDVIDTISSKAVLILGRFSPERKIILDRLREDFMMMKSEREPGMFDHIRRFPWVIDGAFEYENAEEVITPIPGGIINPVENKLRELTIRR